jgi:AcrR family transcriptional regulator
MADSPPNSRRSGSAASPDEHSSLVGRGLPHGVVVENQERRIARSLADSIFLRGYQGTTVQHVIEPVGLSRRTFYDIYRDKAEAFCAVHGEALSLLGSEVEEACEGERHWPDGVGTAIAAALQWAAAQPREAGLLVMEPLTAGPRSGYCEDLLSARFAPLLLRARTLSPQRRPSSTEIYVLGGIVSTVASRLRSDRASELPELAKPLTEFVLASYLGPVETRAAG